MKKVLFPAFDNGFLQLVTDQRSCDLNTDVLLRTDPRERTTFQLRTICAMQKVPDYPACDWKGLLHCKYFEAFHGTTFVCLPMLLWQLSSVHWLLWQRNSDEALLLSGTKSSLSGGLSIYTRDYQCDRYVYRYSNKNKYDKYISKKNEE